MRRRPLDWILLVALALLGSVVEAAAGRVEGVASAQHLLRLIEPPEGLAGVVAGLQGRVLESCGLVWGSAMLGFPFRFLAAAGAWSGAATRGGRRAGWAAATMMLAFSLGRDSLDPGLVGLAFVSLALGEPEPRSRVAARVLASGRAGRGALLAVAGLVLVVLGVTVGAPAVPPLRELGQPWWALLGTLAVLTLLRVGDRATVARLVEAAVLGLVGAWWPEQVVIVVVPLLMLAGATPMSWAVVVLGVGLGASAVARPGLVDPSARWPDGPDVPPLRDQALRWLAERAGGATPARVQLDADPAPGWSSEELTAVAWAKGLDLSFVAPEAEAELGLVLSMVPSPSLRAAWRALLPPATVTWPAPGLELRAWDRPLPSESLLLDPDPGRHHPARQGLFVRLGSGEERGPLLSPASSPTVVRGPEGWWCWFVREQSIWRSESADGLAWSTPVPTGISAFDPDAQLRDGRWWLWVAEVVGVGAEVDPAEHPTRFRLYSGLDPRALAPVEEGPSGQGRVDPAADGAGHLYFTEDRREIRRLRAAGGGWELDPAFRVAGFTVPAPVGDWLLAQRHVGPETAIYALRRQSDGGFAEPVPLEVCGSAPTVVGERLYYSRDSSTPRCGPPVAYPSRKAGVPWLSP